MIETVTAFASALEPQQLFLARVGACAFLLLAGLYGGRVIRPVVAAFSRRVERHMPQWLHEMVRGFAEPVELLLRLGLLGAGVLAAPLPQSWATQIRTWMSPGAKALIVALAAWGFWRAAPLCRMALNSAEERLDIHASRTIGGFLENLYRVLIALFAVLAVLDLLGVPVASLIAGAGLVGLAISLAAQSTLTNLIAGVTLVLERPFSVGDFIILGDFSGTVEKISLRSTRLRTPDNVAVTVENSKVCAEYIQNSNDRDSRLWTFTLRLPYEVSCEKLDALCAQIRDILLQDGGIKSEPLSVTVDEVGQDGVKLLVRCYTTTADYMVYLQIHDRVNRRILTLLEREGCQLAYPPSSVYVGGKNA